MIEVDGPPQESFLFPTSDFFFCQKSTKNDYAKNCYSAKTIKVRIEYKPPSFKDFKILLLKNVKYMVQNKSAHVLLRIGQMENLIRKMSQEIVVKSTLIFHVIPPPYFFSFLLKLGQLKQQTNFFLLGTTLLLYFYRPDRKKLQ